MRGPSEPLNVAVSDCQAEGAAERPQFFEGTAISTTAFVNKTVIDDMGFSARINILMHGFIVASTSAGCDAGEDRRGRLLSKLLIGNHVELVCERKL